jgi:hypothetical protein
VQDWLKNIEPEAWMGKIGVKTEEMLEESASVERVRKSVKGVGTDT